MSYFVGDVEFVSGTLDDCYKCVKCSQILHDPMQFPCGHRCCSECVNAMFAVENGDRGKCPCDLQTFRRKEVFPDVYAKRELFEFKCFCSNKKKGCEWKGEYPRFREHYSVCAYADVSCVFSSRGCDAVVPKSELAHHIEKDCPFRLRRRTVGESARAICKTFDAKKCFQMYTPDGNCSKKDCPFRLVDCEHCELEHRAKDSSDHLKECPRILVECPHGCNRDKFFRELLPEHEKSCPKMPTVCVFSNVGCNFRGPRESLDDHIGSNAPEHLILAGDFIGVVLARLELHQKTVDSCVEANKKHEKRLSAQQTIATLNKNTLFAHQEKMVRIEGSLRHLEKILERLKKSEVGGDDVKKQLNLFDERLSIMGAEIEAMRGSRDPPRSSPSGSRESDRLDHHLRLHEIQIQEQAQAIFHLENTSYDGTYIMKIDDVQRRFQDAISGKYTRIESPPFYTSRRGYRCQMSVYLNGDGEGRGTHMSIFLVMMRGDFDAILSWPFKQKVTFTLIDQEKNNDHLDSFRPRDDDTSWRRPRSTRNVGSGMPVFILHENLSSGGYIRDDTMYIRAQIDTIGLRNL
ncbi:TNF receptor-associated factor 3-like [Montipora foliosa]|uniref:TNF receptor-associated factor 3-like n=1 Tax=Montipora foliosa TaxID=591990 RepID=UPI0035F15C55